MFLQQMGPHFFRCHFTQENRRDVEDGLASELSLIGQALDGAGIADDDTGREFRIGIQFQ